MGAGRVRARDIGASDVRVGKGVGVDERGQTEHQAWAAAENLTENVTSSEAGMSLYQRTVQRLNQFGGVAMGMFHGNRVGIVPAAASASLTR